MLSYLSSSPIIGGLEGQGLESTTGYMFIPCGVYTCPGIEYQRQGTSYRSAAWGPANICPASGHTNLCYHTGGLNSQPGECSTTELCLLPSFDDIIVNISLFTCCSIGIGVRWSATIYTGPVLVHLISHYKH